MKKNTSCFREGVLICLVALLSAALLFIPPPLRPERAPGKAVCARVLSVDDSGLTRHGLLLYGTQNLTVELDGKIFRAANELRGQPELDKVFKSGEKAVVILQGGEVPQKSVLTARDHYRNFWSFTLFALFCVLLILFGSFTGLKALFSFLFSCLVIWKLVIPLVLKGAPASWLIFGAVVILSGVITFLVAGLTRKGLAAFTGSVSGIFAGLLMAHLFGKLMHINGAGQPYVQTLLYSGYDFIDVPDIFIGSMILAGSGAVMDLAMDIASGVEEVSLHSPRLSCRELISSGMRIGRSVTGTMTTTLLLAYSGGYLTLLMVFSAQGTPVLEFLNSTLVASELVKTLIGSFSLVLVAPLTAVVSGWIFSRRQKKGTSPDRSMEDEKIS